MLYAVRKVITIPRAQTDPTDPHTLALSALGWVLSSEDRASRLLSLTGLTPDALRDGLGNPEVMGAVIEFLCAHEPDLVAAADALGVTPEALVAASGELAR